MDGSAAEDRARRRTNETGGGKFRPFTWIERVLDAFFGYDVFISYKRSQATVYADALRGALVKREYRCFLDRVELAPSVELTPELALALRRSKMLILLGTSEAPASLHVQSEVSEFSRYNRPILPIDFDGVLGSLASDHPLTQNISAFIRRDETPEKIATGPSDETLGAILSAFKFRLRNTRRRQALAVLALVFAAIAGIAVRQMLDAQSAKRAADAAAALERQARLAAQEAERRAQASADAEHAARLDAEAFSNMESDPYVAASDLLDSMAHQKVISARTEALLRTWNGRRLQRVLPGHTNNLLAIDWRGDDKYLASGGYDRTVRLWNPGAWTLVRDVPFPDTISSLCFPHEPGKKREWIAVGGEAGLVGVIDLETGELIWVRKLADSPIRALFWGSTMSDLYVWAPGVPVQSLRPNDGRSMHSWRCRQPGRSTRPNAVQLLTLDLDGGHIALGCGDALEIGPLYGAGLPVRIAGMGPASAAALLEMHKTSSRLARKPNAPAPGLALLGGDVSGRFFRIDSSGTRVDVPIGTDVIQQLVVHYGEVAVVDEKSAKFINPRTLAFEHRAISVPDGIHRATWPEDGRELATVSAQAAGVRVYRLDDSTFAQPFGDFSAFGEVGVAMSGSGRLAIVEIGHLATVYASKHGLGASEAATAAGDLDPFECGSLDSGVIARPAWRDTSPSFAVGDTSGVVHIFSINDAGCREDLQCPSVGSLITAVSMLDAGVLISTRSETFLCNIDTVPPALSKYASPTSVAYARASHDRVQIAGHSDGGRSLHVWGNGSEPALQSWSLPGDADSAAHPIAWSPTDRFLAISGPRGRVYVIDPRRPGLLRQTPAGAFAFDLAWSPDERRLAVARYDGKLLVYDWSDSDWTEPRASFSTSFDKLSAVAWPTSERIVFGGSSIGHSAFLQAELPPVSTIRSDLESYVAWYRSIDSTVKDPPAHSRIQPATGPLHGDAGVP